MAFRGNKTLTITDIKKSCFYDIYFSCFTNLQANGLAAECVIWWLFKSLAVFLAIPQVSQKYFLSERIKYSLRV